ncbi:hypothetical protein BDR22DRAFT_855484 [Usnea florida]
MVYSSQSYSATLNRHGAATMSSEKQNGSSRRPIANTTTLSPKWARNGNGVARTTAPSATSGSSVRPREDCVDGLKIQNGELQEDVATPVKAFLSSNITPRSGSRKARVESASSTPSGAPNGIISGSKSVSRERWDPTEDARAASGLGLRISTSGRRSRASSVISDGFGSSISSRPSLLERQDSAMRTTSPESSPMFVYANDVKASLPSRPTAGRSLSKEQLPAHEQFKDGSVSNGRSSSMSNNPSVDESRPKFFYANDYSPDPKLPRISNGTPSQRPPLQTIYSAHVASSPPRAVSPLKEEVLPRRSSVNKPSPRRHTRLVSNGGTEIKPSEMAFGTTDMARRSSMSSPGQPRVASHSRSSSVQSAGPSPRRRASATFSNTSPTAVERARTTSMTVSNGALPHSVNPPAATQELHSTQSSVQPHSPTRPSAVGESKIDQMNELAAKARRERKVLDLEISNSSLLAINRTLEREMRKQTAELRRFRRLSRSGRLSVADRTRSASEKTEFLANGTSPLDSDNEEEDEGNLSSDISSPATASSRPSSPTSRARRTRFQDPELRELDLGAHRALLLDSQKLNQSIKRCLEQTESLIACGKEALDRQVRAPTPDNLGGRVLAPDDIDDSILGQGQGLLSPSPFTSGNPFERNLGIPASLDGGLETPDYSKWGPPTEVQTPFAEIGDLMASDELDGTTAMDILHVTGKNEGDGIDAAISDLVNENRNLDRHAPSLIKQRHSHSDISIDGIDDSNDNSSLDDDDYPEDEPPQHQGSPSHQAPPPLQPPIQEPNDLSRPSSPSKILNAMRPPDAKSDAPGNVPGNRGSMQNLGHYLQAFSLFGGVGQSQG